MKFRNGFVSNSSSSSFVLTSRTKITEEMLNKALGIPEEHPLHSLVSSVTKCIISSSKLVDEDELREWRADYEKYKDSYSKERLDLVEQNNFVYTGYFSDDSGDPIETMLCLSGINVKTEDFEIKCEGGY